MLATSVSSFRSPFLSKGFFILHVTSLALLYFYSPVVFQFHPCVLLAVLNHCLKFYSSFIPYASLFYSYITVYVICVFVVKNTLECLFCHTNKLDYCYLLVFVLLYLHVPPPPPGFPCRLSHSIKMTQKTCES